MQDPRLKEVIQEEAETFYRESCTLYVNAATSLKLPTSTEEALITAGSSRAIRYADSVVSALQNHRVAMVVGRGEHVQKAVSVVELAKQKVQGRVVQFSKLSLEQSLIHPGIKAELSLKNVQAFYGDVGTATEEDALREIHGHKVYTVPTFAVFLVRDMTVPEDLFTDWSKQVKQ